MIVYLDESGNLGFDFETKHPSRYFVITALVCSQSAADKQLHKAVARTIKNKLGHREGELKGAKTELRIKAYFLAQLCQEELEGFGIYALVVDKQAIDFSCFNTHQFYNQMAACLLRQIVFERGCAINLVVDKSKNKYDIKVFDRYLTEQLDIPSDSVLYIRHHLSKDNYGLQAVDLSCWGILRKYERQDESWYRQYAAMIELETCIERTPLC